jgi:hypothetical protein
MTNKNRALAITRQFGPFTLSASFVFNKQTGEYDILQDMFCDGRGKSGTDVDRHLDDAFRWVSRCIQGRGIK